MYIDKCNDKQVKELMSCYADFTNIEIDRREEYLLISVTVDGMDESYELYDYDVVVYDWDDSDTSCLYEYRLKMLDFFGNDYATNYLLYYNI